MVDVELIQSSRVLASTTTTTLNKATSVASAATSEYRLELGGCTILTD